MLAVEIEQLVAACSTAPDPNARKAVSRRLAHLRKGLAQVASALGVLSVDSTDVCLLLTLYSLIHGVKLPKLDVPTFDGNLLNWRTFWEQFCILVHDRTSLSNVEKLVYLQQSLKGGSAKNVIEGLSRTGDNYDEAIQSLTTRYDRPRLIHQAHALVSVMVVARNYAVSMTIP